MLKLLTPLLLPGKSILTRSTLATQQPIKYFSQNASDASVSAQENIENSGTVTNETEELEKLYSRLEIELRGSDPAVMKSFQRFAVTSAGHLGIEVGQVWDQRKAHHERYTLLKSAFVHKKHRVQYEIRTYFKFMHFHRLTGSTLSTFLEYIERNLPEGVALKATKIELLEMPEHLRQPPPAIEHEEIDSNGDKGDNKKEQ